MKKIITILSLIIISIITFKVLLDKTIYIDSFYNIVKNIINDDLTKYIKLFTNISGAIVLISLTLLLSLIISDRNIRILIPCNVTFIFLLNYILKVIIRRPRPVVNQLISEIGFSYPSGHSMVGTAFYGLLLYLVYKYVKNKYLKYSLMVLLSIIIIFVPLSRVYLGVHYTSDVLVGFLISIVYLIFLIDYLKDKKYVK